MALSHVVGLLQCPTCAGALTFDGRVVRCSARHAFDVARQGYVNLLAGRRGADTGDTAAMVQARRDFLDGGWYQPIAERIVAAARTAAGGGKEPVIVDAGAGPGYYLARVLDAVPHAVGIACDLSTPALRVAAGAHDRLGAVGCDVWNVLPVRSGVADVLLNVFAPRNGPEMLRILASDGAAIVVTPTPAHLRELIEPLGLLTVDADKARRVDASLMGFVAEDVTELTFDCAMDSAALRRVVAMGPSAWHVGPGVAARLAALPSPLTVTASVTVAVYRPDPHRGARATPA